MELFDLYTENRELTGKTMERGGTVPEGLYRLVVHICVFNSRGEMLIQRRQPFKAGWPGLWDISVGGGAVAGENAKAAAERETREELGLTVTLDRPVLTIHFDEGFDDFFITTADRPAEEFSPQYEEVAEVKWAGKEEILGKIRDGSFIPYHESLIGLLFFLRGHRGTFNE